MSAMPSMSRLQTTVCTSAAWRSVAGAVLSWALQGFDVRGDVLEIGAGSGALAREVLTRFDHARLTVTDFDPAMVERAERRLSEFADRVDVRPADATALPFGDRSFDVVLSCLMLHHTVAWERALSESLRVLRPGGHLVGFDLLAVAPLRLLHRDHGDRVRLPALDELQRVVDDLPCEDVVLTPGFGGSLLRFRVRRGGGPR
jgi:ubiquinone/menaquinone biosynthesis C-methylase UbiE